MGVKVKKLDKYLDKLNDIPNELKELSKSMEEMKKTDVVMTRALRGLIRNDLYRSFKENRELGAWTDDESRVQTSLHEIYQSLGGNGEETIWWNKKQNWKIVTQEEYEKLYVKMIEERC